MFLQCRIRKKDGKVHRSWSIEESRRVGKRILHRHVLYLGELNDSQQRAWRRTLEVFDQDHGKSRQMSLFADDAPPAPPGGVTIAEHEQVRMHLRLEHPRQWGACFLANNLYEQLHLDAFFAPRLGNSTPASPCKNPPP